VPLQARILVDIEAGMIDSALREKYKLSSVGLESSFKKLRESDMIRHVSAMDIVQDLKAGTVDSQLMEKYIFLRKLSGES
jgi:hypothetical protein